MRLQNENHNVITDMEDDKYRYETYLKELRAERVELERLKETIISQVRDERERLDKWKECLDDVESNNKDKIFYYLARISMIKASIFEDAEIYLSRERRAWKASEIVKDLKQKFLQESKKRLEAESMLEFYEYIYPHLKEDRIKNDTFDIPNFSSSYTEKERADELHFWLTPDEYRKLPTEERNQLALDRYKQKSLSNWEIGKLYEQYIGFLHEEKGYLVHYTGIKDKFEDKGRDLICENEAEVLIIQCKNWSSSKTIYEKHIFQFFGSVFEYTKNIEEKKRSIPRKVRGIFYTTTELSDFAREAANFLNIELVEKHDMNKDYPCIKCNIGRDGEKIYHLPFDQQYDVTKIEPRKGEFYARTCSEAENKGFRRAMRYFGTKF